MIKLNSKIVAGCLLILCSACSDNNQSPELNTSSKTDITGTIYFGARTMGPSVNIYAIEGPGQKLQKLTSDSRWRDLELDVDKNKNLIFISNRETAHQIDLHKQREVYDLFVQKAGSSEPKKLTNSDNTELSPRFSPDDRWVAYTEGNNESRTLILLNRESNEIKPLLSSKSIHSFAWSPDSKEIVVGHSDPASDFGMGKVAGSYLSKVTIDSGDTAIVVALPGQLPNQDYKVTDQDPFKKSVSYVSWSPGGNYIAYIRNPLYKGIRQLFLYDLKQKTQQAISSAEAQVQDGISWSNDEQSLLYSALIDFKFYFDEQAQRKVYEGGMHIFKHELQGSSTQITDGDHMFRSPTYSPDNRHIAYFYSDKLGARTYSLKITPVDSFSPELLFEQVSPASTLIWR